MKVQGANQLDSARSIGSARELDPDVQSAAAERQQRNPLLQRIQTPADPTPRLATVEEDEAEDSGVIEPPTGQTPVSNQVQETAQGIANESPSTDPFDIQQADPAAEEDEEEDDGILNRIRSIFNI